jgi:hypothetical protein
MFPNLVSVHLIIGTKLHHYTSKMATPSEVIMVSHHFHRPSQEEVPKVRMQDVMYGNVRPHGQFEALVWRSRIALRVQRGNH